MRFHMASTSIALTEVTVICITSCRVRSIFSPRSSSLDMTVCRHSQASLSYSVSGIAFCPHDRNRAVLTHSLHRIERNGDWQFVAAFAENRKRHSRSHRALGWLVGEMRAMFPVNISLARRHKLLDGHAQKFIGIVARQTDG